METAPTYVNVKIYCFTFVQKGYMNLDANQFTVTQKPTAGFLMYSQDYTKLKQEKHMRKLMVKQ